MSYPTCSGISCSADCADRDPRLRKDDVLKAQSGRSMIEMLGVLAIIGVLSVGGIAGYSKAMTQYKINKTVDQISQVVGNVRTLFASQRNYLGFGCVNCSRSSSGAINKAHLVPDEMWNSSGNLENPFGGSVWLVAANKKRSGDNKAFAITLYDLPEEACMSLSTYDWGSGSSSGLMAISVNNGTTAMYDGYCHSSCAGSTSDGKAVACPNGGTVTVPMPVNVAATACQEGDGNEITLKFY